MRRRRACYLEEDQLASRTSRGVARVPGIITSLCANGCFSGLVFMQFCSSRTSPARPCCSVRALSTPGKRFALGCAVVCSVSGVPF